MVISLFWVNDLQNHGLLPFSQFYHELLNLIRMAINFYFILFYFQAYHILSISSKSVMEEIMATKCRWIIKNAPLHSWHDFH